MTKSKLVSSETDQIYHQLENLSLCCPTVSMFIAQSQHLLTPYLMLCDISIIEKKQVIDHFSALIKASAGTAVGDKNDEALDVIKKNLVETAQRINDDYEKDAKEGDLAIEGGHNSCLGCQNVAFLTKQIVEIRKFLKMDEGEIRARRLDAEAQELLGIMEEAQKAGFPLTDSQKELMAEMKKRMEEREKEKLEIN